MKPLHILSLIFSVLISTLLTYGQDTHVRSEYVKETNKTVIQTDWLRLLNSPQQFLELLLSTQYAGQQLKKSPEKLDLVIWSFSKDVQYKESEYQKLLITTDGESWSIEPKTRVVFKGETKDGQNIFWEEKRPMVGQPSALPASAQVKEGQAINSLFMEQFYYQLRLDQLLKIATAKTVEAKLGTTGLSFTINQLNTIRSFTSQVNPSFRYEQNSAESAAGASDSQSQDTTDVVDAGVINGKAVRLPKPEYPSAARAARASGTVDVFVTVDETGKVIAARAISGHPSLRDGAETAARRALFSPTIIAGKSVKVTGIIVYNYVALMKP